MKATAFNLLTRDGVASGTVVILGGGTRHPLPGSGVAVLFAVSGDWQVTSGAGGMTLPEGSALLAEDAGALTAEAPADARLAAVAVTLA